MVSKILPIEMFALGRAKDSVDGIQMDSIKILFLRRLEFPWKFITFNLKVLFTFMVL